MNKCFNFLLLLFGLTIGSWLNAQTIMSNGTFTFSTAGSFSLVIPADCTADITYEIWGGGGGGGNINLANANTPFRAAPGGGGGGYSTGTLPGQGPGTYPVIVGAGGIVTNFATSRQNGTASSAFGVTSGGGQGGGPTGAGSGGSGDVVGGAGGLRDGNATSGIGGGGGGGSGPVVTNGDDGVGSMGGAGGMPNGGDGSDAGGNGANGTAPGGGGGGKGAGGNSINNFPDGTGVLVSGDGGDGQVIIVVTNYSCLVLPVELIGFKATVNNKQIALEWQTASELDNKGFEIQKSIDGIAWDMIDFVEGQGTVFDLNTYSYIDKAPAQGLNYYRLKQVDYDGAQEFSKAISIKFNETRIDMKLYPTLAKEELNVDLTNFADKNVTINILNTNGQLLLNRVVNSSEIVTLNLIDLNLSEGTYYVRCHSERQTTTKKFLVVK